jgi:hypothetical protein
MNKPELLLRPFTLALLLSVIFALSAPLFLFSQDSKETIPPPKPPAVTPAQKGGATCGKSATEAQINGIAAKIREFQAKRQAKAAKDQPKPAEQAANRKP